MQLPLNPHVHLRYTHGHFVDRFLISMRFLFWKRVVSSVVPVPITREVGNPDSFPSDIGQNIHWV